MTDSFLPTTAPSALVDQPSALVWVRRLIWKIAIATLALMAVGSATRVMNAGLACPDWPLCYGQLVPTQQMNLRVFLEWFHRLDASLVGFSTLALVGLILFWRQSLPRWLPWSAVGALLLIVFQGVLGGLTVTQMLRFDIVTAHLGAAMLFFCTLLVMGTALLPQPVSNVRPAIPFLSTVGAGLIYLQSLLGALVGSQWAAHQCFGANQLCTVMNSHIAGVVPPTLTILLLGWVVYRTPALTQTIRTLTAIAVALVGVQITLGIVTFRLHLQVEPLTVSHHLIGVTLLGTLVILSVSSWRGRLSQSQT